MSSSYAPRADSELPAVDARLVAPGSRYEILDGVLVYVPPAGESVGALRANIAALAEAHVAANFKVAISMLTRTSNTSDIAPDVSVFPCARDRQTGGRQLEQLAFVIVGTRSPSHARRKAAMLVARGVRRVFIIDVKSARALEWSRQRARWIALETNAHIEDPTLAAPLPVKALISTEPPDDAIVRALIIKKNPVIEEIRRAAIREGLAEARRKSR